MEKGLQIQVMDGKMKGQAFITFPTIEHARQALHETTGYLFSDKPMIVQFAKVK